MIPFTPTNSKASNPTINLYLVDNFYCVLHTPPPGISNPAIHKRQTFKQNSQTNPKALSTSRNKSILNLTQRLKNRKTQRSNTRSGNLLDLVVKNSQEISSTNEETPKTHTSKTYSSRDNSISPQKKPSISGLPTSHNPKPTSKSGRNLLNLAKKDPKKSIIPISPILSRHSSGTSLEVPRNPRVKIACDSHSRFSVATKMWEKIEEEESSQALDWALAPPIRSQVSSRNLLAKLNLSQKRIVSPQAVSKCSAISPTVVIPEFSRTLTVDFLSPNNLESKKAIHRSRTTSDGCHVKMTNVIKKKIHEGRIHINEYTLMEELGRGAFGSVFKCQKDTGKLFAVKIYRKRTLKSKWLGRGITGLDCVNNEIEVLSNIHHPYIIDLHEVIHAENKNKIYLILEYAPKGSLKERIPFPENQARVYFKQLIEGCIYLHSHNIAHKDIKPENLLISADNKLKIADFGSAETMMHGKIGGKGNSSTYAYMSPELVRGDPEIYGEPVDVWASGVTLYYMIHGELPFNEKKLQNLYEAIKKKEVKVGQGFSKELQNLIDGLLDKDPFKRIKLNQILSHPWINQYSKVCS